MTIPAELLERPFVLLGVPYRVEVVVMPDPYDSECVRYIDRGAGVIRLQEGTSETFLKRMLFSAISREATQILDISRDFDYDLDHSFSGTYYGILRRNPDVLAFCAGWSDEVPDGVEVAGVDWTINLVDFCPGHDKDTFGMTVWKEQVIYLVGDLNLPLMRQVLLHELAHAAADVSAPSLMGNEAYIRAVHTAMYLAFRDNEEWIRYLFS